MKTFRSAVALSASLAAAVLLSPGFSLADDTPLGVEPTEPAPTWTPPPPTEVNFAGGEEFVAQQAVPSGQWVFTSQYGWIWMPHGNSFTFLPANGSTPNMFVFYPSVGWSWVIAPWVWGWGPMPWFGFAGWNSFAWWGSGFGTWHGFARPYAHAGWHGGGYYHGGRWNGVGPGYRPPPGRGGAVPPPRPGSGSRPGGPVANGAPPRGGSGGPVANGAPPRGGPGRGGAMPGAVSGRAGTAPASGVPGRSGAVPARTYGSAGRTTGLPQNYGTWRGMAQGSRGFTSGGAGQPSRGPSMTASRGGFSGGGGARSGGFGGGGGGGGGRSSGGGHSGGGGRR